VLLGGATLRAGYLLAFKGSELRQRAATQQVQNTVVPAKRGTISDRHGKEQQHERQAEPSND
jgi:cell division protein FtsI/penicillin-binding protein 2